MNLLIREQWNGTIMQYQLYDKGLSLYVAK